MKHTFFLALLLAAAIAFAAAFEPKPLPPGFDPLDVNSTKVHDLGLNMIKEFNKVNHHNQLKLKDVQKAFMKQNFGEYGFSVFTVLTLHIGYTDGGCACCPPVYVFAYLHIDNPMDVSRYYLSCDDQFCSNNIHYP